MQREAAALNSVNTIMDTRIKMQTQERLNKQMDLQNKKLEWDQLQEGAKQLEETLMMDKGMFLQRDQAEIDAQYEAAGVGASALANSDIRDVNTMFKNANIKRSIIYANKKGFANKEKFLQSGKVLDEIDVNLKRAEQIAKLGYLKEDEYINFQNAATNLAKKRGEFANGTLQDWDIYSDPDYLVASSAPSFIDYGEQKLVFDTQQKAANAEIQEDLIMSEYKVAQTQQLKELMPYKIEQLKAETQNEILETRLKGVDLATKERGLKEFNTALAAWETANPDADFNDRVLYIEDLKNKMFGKSTASAANTLPSSMNEEIARRVSRGEISAEEGMRLLNTKESTVNYKSDSAGRQGAVDEKGNVNYGGYWTINKDGGDEWGGGTYGNRKIEAKYHKDDIEANIIQPQSDGSLKIKGNDKVIEIFGIDTSYFAMDSTDIKAAIPGAEKVGDYWIIPPDNITAPVQAAPTNTSGTIIPKVGTNSGSTRPKISPDNPFNK